MAMSRHTDPQVTQEPGEKSFELKQLELARAELELERKKVDERQTFLHRHPGILVAATAVLGSLVQLGLSQWNQGRQGRLAFTRYVSENYDLIFSPDAVKRARMRNAMWMAFPRNSLNPFWRPLRKRSS